MDYSALHPDQLKKEYFRLFKEWQEIYRIPNKTDEENGKEDGIWQILEEIEQELKDRDYYLSSDGMSFAYVDFSQLHAVQDMLFDDGDYDIVPDDDD
jgi:hypothetical protein